MAAVPVQATAPTTTMVTPVRTRTTVTRTTTTTRTANRRLPCHPTNNAITMTTLIATTTTTATTTTAVSFLFTITTGSTIHPNGEKKLPNAPPPKTTTTTTSRERTTIVSLVPATTVPPRRTQPTLPFSATLPHQKKAQAARTAPSSPNPPHLCSTIYTPHSTQLPIASTAATRNPVSSGHSRPVDPPRTFPPSKPPYPISATSRKFPTGIFQPDNQAGPCGRSSSWTCIPIC
jgi:hypothetical protein